MPQEQSRRPKQRWVNENSRRRRSGTTSRQGRADRVARPPDQHQPRCRIGSSNRSAMAVVIDSRPNSGIRSHVMVLSIDRENGRSIGSREKLPSSPLRAAFLTAPAPQLLHPRKLPIARSTIFRQPRARGGLSTRNGLGLLILTEPIPAQSRLS